MTELNILSPSVRRENLAQIMREITDQELVDELTKRKHLIKFGIRTCVNLAYSSTSPSYLDHIRKTAAANIGRGLLQGGAIKEEETRIDDMHFIDFELTVLVDNGNERDSK